jgi:putative DNA primase/helicase
LLPFTVTIPESERDKRLAEKLLAELPGILRCAVEGCLAWHQEGLKRPLAVRLVTDDYQAEMDVITAFLLERCVKGSDKQVSKADLYADYAGWFTLRGVLAGTPKAFGSAFLERGFADDHTSGVYFWLGIALREDTEGQSGDT